MKRLLLCLTWLILAGLYSPTTIAQTTFHWLNTSGGSYHTSGNWTPLGGPPLFDDFARFGLSATYGVNFSSAGTQTIDFQVSNGNVTFSFLNPTAQHFWGASSTNYVGPAAGAVNSSATLNLTNMGSLPMRGFNLVVGRAAGKTGTLNIFNNGNWDSYNNGSVIIGSEGTGNLNISTTGILQNSSLKTSSLAIGNGGNGVASVSGFNASLTTDLLSLGSGSSSLGKLTISNQGKATVFNSMYVGGNSSFDNEVTVTGNGSELVLGKEFSIIGSGGLSPGKGTLNVLNGGKVTNSGSSIIVGAGTTSVGTVNITGNGSQLLSTGLAEMTVGSGGSGAINVNGGGNLTVSQLKMGSSAGALGTLSLAGNGTLVDIFGSSTNFIGESGTGAIALDSGSVLNSNGDLVFGSVGVGTLTVNGGSQVYSASGRVGQGAANSSASISGSGSLWSMTGALDVGWSNSATLQLDNGAQAISNGGRLGTLAGGNGYAIVAGAGSNWNNAGTSTFVIAQSGQGWLDIANGGSMTSNHVSIASQATGTGTVNLYGSSSQWSIGKGISIGDDGLGELSIADGGKLAVDNNAFVRIGHDAGAQGSLIVKGAGSNVAGGTGSFLTVGRSGAGTLDVRQGGAVNVANGRIGQLVGGVGSAMVRNAGSQWNNAETLEVGTLGHGTLAIQNAGKVTAKNLTIGREFDSAGTVTLSGLSSSLEVAQEAIIGGGAGDDGGVGSLNVQSGSTASIGNQLTLWSQGTVNLLGGTLKLGSLNNQGGQLNWNSGTVQFTQNTILNDSLLNSLLGPSHALGNGQFLQTASGQTLIVGNTHFAVDGGQVQTANFTNVGSTAINKGSLHASGHFLNDVQGHFVVQNLGQTSFAGGVTNNGGFQLASAAAKSSGGVFNNNGTISGRGRLQHQLLNNGLVAISSGDQLINENGANATTNHGQIQLTGGRLEVTGLIENSAGAFMTGHGVLGTSTGTPGSLGLINNGTIAVSGGAMDIYGDVRNLAEGRVHTSGHSTTTFWDDVEHNGSEIRTSAGSSTVFFGSVTGAAPYTGSGSVFFEGDLKPGNSPANVTFEGDLHFGEFAKLNIELGGLLAGLDYDQLTVHGSAWLDGLLSIDLTDGFNPTLGNSFTVIRNRGSSPLFGQFIGLNQGASLFAGGHQFTVDYFGGSGHDFVLTSVPEPSSAVLLVVSLVGFGLVRRRPTTNLAASPRMDLSGCTE